MPNAMIMLRPRFLFSIHTPALLLAGSLLFATSSCGILGPDDGSGEPDSGEVTILFLGSSYLDSFDVPDRVKGFAREAGKGVFIRSRLIPGLYLDHFAQEPQTTAMIRERAWDYVVLQGGSQNAAYPMGSGHSVSMALRELHRKATELSPDTKVVYMMPWAFEDGMTWIEGRDETYEIMQLDIRENTLRWAEDMDLVVAPVGMAFYQVLTTWDPPEHYLHLSDWNHASHRGAYLAAATIYSTVFGESVTEVNYRWTLDVDLARDFREVASTTVMDSLSLWRITP
ncbi:DUF4886 domain-containing protein [Gemmatimonadota bacterium]